MSDHGQPAPRPAPRSPGAGTLEVPSWGLGPFTRPPSGNPIILPDTSSVFHCPMRGGPVHWESLHTFNPAAVVHAGVVHLLYRAEDDSGPMIIGGHTSRIGMATSDDGIAFTRRRTPVLFPDRDGQQAWEWEGGCEDPRCVMAEDGTFVLTYTMYDRRVARLAVATSRDLITWTKHGPAWSGTDRDCWSKSGGIVCAPGDRGLVAVRLGGRYWMYWGEHGVHLAHSPDLIHWTPVRDANGRFEYVLPTRAGFFDSDLVEGGPPPVLTGKGIVVLYNAKNKPGTEGDTAYPGQSYNAGQALFDPQDPRRLLGRCDRPFFSPSETWEATGQYSQGATFIEGLVLHRGKWFLYYGCADSRVAVATAPAGTMDRGHPGS